MSHILETVLLGFLLVGGARAGDGFQGVRGLPSDTSQVVLVQSVDWTAVTATLDVWRKQEGGWTCEFSVPVVDLGRAGMGWGVGLHAEGPASDPQKHEGDGRAPAGIFRLGTGFGRAATAPEGSRGFPYRSMTTYDRFVDDPKSVFYNTWQGDESRKDWDSAETMLREDGLYDRGVVVEHNTGEQRVAGRGSAIFLHIWRAEGMGTAGCTAMPREAMERLLTVLDPAARPVLIQGPRTVIQGLSP